MTKFDECKIYDSNGVLLNPEIHVPSHVKPLYITEDGETTWFECTACRRAFKVTWNEWGK